MRTDCPRPHRHFITSCSEVAIVTIAVLLQSGCAAPANHSRQQNHAASVREAPTVTKVENVRFTVTTTPQYRSGGLQINANGITNPNQITATPAAGPAIPLPDGSIFLLVEADISPSKGQVVNIGENVYLTDSTGEKIAGFYKHPLLGWLGNGFSFSYTGEPARPDTMQLLFPIKPDHKSGAILHLLNGDFPVPDN